MKNLGVTLTCWLCLNWLGGSLAGIAFARAPCTLRSGPLPVRLKSLTWAWIPGVQSFGPHVNWVSIPLFNIFSPTTTADLCPGLGSAMTCTETLSVWEFSALVTKFPACTTIWFPEELMHITLPGDSWHALGNWVTQWSCHTWALVPEVAKHIWDPLVCVSHKLAGIPQAWWDGDSIPDQLVIPLLSFLGPW